MCTVRTGGKMFVIRNDLLSRGAASIARPCRGAVNGDLSKETDMSLDHRFSDESTAFDFDWSAEPAQSGVNDVTDDCSILSLTMDRRASRAFANLVVSTLAVSTPQFSTLAVPTLTVSTSAVPALAVPAPAVPGRAVPTLA